MTIFRSRGFDSIIGPGLVIDAIQVKIPPQSTLMVEGLVTAELITGGQDPMDSESKPAPKTTLQVAGTVNCGKITVHNVVISGEVNCKCITVAGTLAVKKGAKLNATNIQYRELIVETGAILNGKMFHLDHLPVETQTA